jgi:long-subunit fatty acid transport protein
MLFILLAAGFFYPDLGATPLGRGGTGVAGAGDLSAFAMNPAGLAELAGLRIQGELSSAWQPIEFARAGNCGARPCATVSNASGTFLNTLSGVSYALRPGLVVAAAVYGPPSMGRENFPDPRAMPPGTSLTGAPQRYSLISENNLIVYPGLGVGVRALPWLDLGAVAQIRYFRARETQSIYTLGLGGEFTDLDAVASADAVDSARFVFGLGAIARPLPGLSVGFSFRPGAPVHATGTLEVELPPFAVAAGASVTGHAARIDFDLPPEARLGARYQSGALSAELDVTWENWGVLRSIRVTPVDIVLHQGGSDTTVGPIEVPRNWRAAWSGRLGGEVQACTWATVRAGALYETSAIPDETFQIDFASPARLALTAGVTARLGKFALTAGYAHFFQQTRTVTNSQVNRVDPYPAPAFAIGDGTYSTSLDVLAVQLSASL